MLHLDNIMEKSEIFINASVNENVHDVPVYK